MTLSITCLTVDSCVSKQEYQTFKSQYHHLVSPFISDISWRSVLLEQETTDLPQVTESHSVVSSTLRHQRGSNSQR
jgi:hypothetical protein